jgi:hypothetical protein
MKRERPMPAVRDGAATPFRFAGRAHVDRIAYNQ